jgi:hypothetical protein
VLPWECVPSHVWVPSTWSWFLLHVGSELVQADQREGYQCCNHYH